MLGVIDTDRLTDKQTVFNRLFNQILAYRQTVTRKNKINIDINKRSIQRKSKSIQANNLIYVSCVCEAMCVRERERERV